MCRWVFLAGLTMASCLVSPRNLQISTAQAFPYVVQNKQSIAQVAEDCYQRVELERLIVAVNHLDGRYGAAIVAGMRLELPAVGHHKVLPGDSWKSIAAALLGGAHRADVLANANQSRAWLPPQIGLEIVVPYNMRYVAERGDTTQSLAYRFLDKRDHAWIIASYNRLKRAVLRQGEVVLVPLTDLPLTETGRRAALNAGALVRSEGGGSAREAQRRVTQALPALALDVRRGNYIRAVARGAELLSVASLSEPQLATIHRLLTETYAALGEKGMAASACADWYRSDPSAQVNALDHSPKILAACLDGVPSRAGGLPAAGATL